MHYTSKTEEKHKIEEQFPNIKRQKETEEKTENS